MPDSDPFFSSIMIRIPFDPYSSGFIFEIQQKKKNSRTINSQIPNWINLECMKANEKVNEQLKTLYN